MGTVHVPVVRSLCFLWVMRNIRGCEIGMMDAFDQGQDDEGEEIARGRQCGGGWVHIQPESVDIV